MEAPSYLLSDGRKETQIDSGHPSPLSRNGYPSRSSTNFMTMRRLWFFLNLTFVLLAKTAAIAADDLAIHIAGQVTYDSPNQAFATKVVNMSCEIPSGLYLVPGWGCGDIFGGGGDTSTDSDHGFILDPRRSVVRVQTPWVFSAYSVFSLTATYEIFEFGIADPLFTFSTAPGVHSSYYVNQWDARKLGISGLGVVSIDSPSGGPPFVIENVSFLLDVTGSEQEINGTTKVVYTFDLVLCKVEPSGGGPPGGGSSQPPAPYISAPSSIGFPKVQLGSNQSQYVVVTNTGSADLVINNVTVTGSDASAFSVGVSGNTFPLVITSGQKATLTVTFSPRSLGHKLAVLSIYHNAQSPNPLTVNLDGGFNTLGEAASALAWSVTGTPGGDNASTHPYTSGAKGWDCNDKYVEPLTILDGYEARMPDVCTSVRGLDCSGLVLWSYNKAYGKEKFPNSANPTDTPIFYQNADGQFWNNTFSISTSDARPGDLLFFDHPWQRKDGSVVPIDGLMDHVAVYVGGDSVASASSTTVGIVERKFSDLIKQSDFAGLGRPTNKANVDFQIRAFCPVGLIVTDPDGYTITPETFIVTEEEVLREVPRQLYYQDLDINGDGTLDHAVFGPHLKEGAYLISVVPEASALPTNTFRLEFVARGEVTLLADGTRVSDIPERGYGVLVSEAGIKPLDLEPPIIEGCPGDITIGNDPLNCSATVTWVEPAAIDNVAVTRFATSKRSGSLFDVGQTIVTYTAEDAAGNMSSCSFTVTVDDREEPEIRNLSTDRSVLWPPNHKLVMVVVNYEASDNCGVASYSLSATSNEPDSGLGDGDQAGDIQLIPGDPHHIYLRAERSAQGNGRNYRVTASCTDTFGNTSSKVVNIAVPKSQRR